MRTAVAALAKRTADTIRIPDALPCIHRMRVACHGEGGGERGRVLLDTYYVARDAGSGAETPKMEGRRFTSEQEEPNQLIMYR